MFMHGGIKLFNNISYINNLFVKNLCIYFTFKDDKYIIECLLKQKIISIYKYSPPIYCYKPFVDNTFSYIDEFRWESLYRKSFPEIKDLEINLNNLIQNYENVDFDITFDLNYMHDFSRYNNENIKIGNLCVVQNGISVKIIDIFPEFIHNKISSQLCKANDDSAFVRILIKTLMNNN